MVLLGIREHLLPSARLSLYSCPQHFGGDAIAKEVANSKITTQQVADHSRY
jgi:hypothetical protein